MGRILQLPDRGAARPAPLARQGAMVTGRRAAREILLVYPGRGGREYLAAFLTSRGHAVMACSDGGEALAHLAARPFALVVTAVLMPGMDGLELTSALRGGPPVIVVADGEDRIDEIYLRSAALCGAVATHRFAEAGGALLASVDKILRGTDPARTGVV